MHALAGVANEASLGVRAAIRVIGAARQAMTVGYRGEPESRCVMLC